MIKSSTILMHSTSGRETATLDKSNINEKTALSELSSTLWDKKQPNVLAKMPTETVSTATLAQNNKNFSLMRKKVDQHFN